MARLLLAISAHGLGHLGQAAPVCNALVAAKPDLDLFIWSALPLTVLRQRIQAPFSHHPVPCDIGFMMHDALQVDVAASWSLYWQREQQWATSLNTACTWLREIQPDLIVSDVGELPLAAGQALGIPTVAMSSLNWADLARAYFANMSESAPVLHRLDQIYAQTTRALRLTPGMPMHSQRETIMPPVGAVSTWSRAALDPLLAPHLPYPDQPRILIGMGGIETRLPWESWPTQSAFNLLVANQPVLPGNGDPARGIVNADTLRSAYGWSFCDLLAGCDAVICKPGYGTFVEAALANTPVLYVRRSDWPEQPALIEWLHAQARCAELAPATLQNGLFANALRALWQQAPKAPVPRDGAELAAREILTLLPSISAGSPVAPAAAQSHAPANP